MSLVDSRKLNDLKSKEKHCLSISRIGKKTFRFSMCEKGHIWHDKPQKNKGQRQCNRCSLRESLMELHTSASELQEIVERIKNKL